MPRISLVLTLLVGGALAFVSPVFADDGVSRFIIALDPGHGGNDPGAQAMGVDEADLVLSFARRLADVLEETDVVDVVLT